MRSLRTQITAMYINTRCI